MSKSQPVIVRIHFPQSSVKTYCKNDKQAKCFFSWKKVSADFFHIDGAKKYISDDKWVNPTPKLYQHIQMFHVKQNKI